MNTRLIPEYQPCFEQHLLDYGTEEQCIEAIAEWRWPSGFECPKCGHKKYCILTNRTLYQCHKCHRQTSVTAGTIFNATKLPLTIWFKILWRINYAHSFSEKLPTAMSLHKEFDISYNAAWRTKRKLLHAWEAGEI